MELGVSGATVRNWYHVGHLIAASTHPLLFDLEAVRDLIIRIKTNQFNRLRKRANKTANERAPVLELDNGEIVVALSRVGAKMEKLGLDPEPVLFLAALRLLEKRGEVTASISAGMVMTPTKGLAWRRTPVRDIMIAWQLRFARPAPVEILEELEDYLRLECPDCLGVLKQALATVGNKSLTGAFLTPWQIIDDALNALGRRPANFLDPCCGTGRYLIRAADIYQLDPSRIYGFDFDPVAVDIARVNLLLRFPDLHSAPNIRCLDSLNELANGEADCDTNHLLDTVDAVATNPPWGLRKNLPGRKDLAALIRMEESFSLFLQKAIQLLKKGGRLTFILPESILHIKAHTRIRRYILEKSTILKISLLGRGFPDVFTPIMRLDLEKSEAPHDWKVTVKRGDKWHHAPQRRFHGNMGHAFDVAVTPRDEDLLARIYGVPHSTLRRNANWAIGIVTGDNAKIVHKAQASGLEPVLCGKDIYKFSSRPPSRFIEFRPENFQQVAPEKYFRAPEKLVYRFISDRLIFAYDNRGLLTLNSANVLIPCIPGLTIKIALAFLNSMVFQYIFSKRFHTRKVLRGDLESLPFPMPTPDLAAAIAAKVGECMSGDYKPAEELDRLILQAFFLDDSDVAIMEESLAEDAEAYQGIS